MLITDDKPPELADDGHDFLDVALEVLRLADEAGVRSEIGKTRILPTGVVILDGEVIRVQTQSAA